MNKERSNLMPGNDENRLQSIHYRTLLNGKSMLVIYSRLRVVQRYQNI